MKLNTSTSVAFTGYRTSKIKRSTSDKNIIDTIEIELQRIIYELYNEGYTNYIVGGSEGFDLMAAEVVLEAREMQPDINLIVAVPFKGQDDKYKPDDKRLYEKVLELADTVHYVATDFHSRAYLNRNDYMLSNSSVVVCYYNGLQGGTMYTYNRAMEKGHRVINLCDYKPLSTI